MGKKPAAAAKAAETKRAAKSTDVVVSKKTVKAKKKTVETKAVKQSEKSCQVKACKRTYRAKGYCNSHYREWRNGKFGIARYKTCKDMDCKKPIRMNGHGYCETHFQNYYVKGVEVVKAAPAEKAAAAPAAKEEKAAVA